MSVYEFKGRDEIFHRIAHDPDDDLLLDAISSIKNPNEADNEGQTYLHFAALHFKVKAVEALLKIGADPNITNKRGTVPLSCAIGRKNPNRVKVVQLLLDYGADLDAKCGEKTIRETIKMFEDSDLQCFVE